MQTVNEYLEHVSPDQMREYARVRSVVCELIPDATETMSYGVPTFKYKGKNLLHFGAFREHVSIFPGPAAIEAKQEKLSDYKLSKGTIRYSTNRPIPEDLIIELLQIRVSEIAK